MKFCNISNNQKITKCIEMCRDVLMPSEVNKAVEYIY